MSAVSETKSNVITPAFRKTRVYENTAAPGMILFELAELKKFDKVAEVRGRVWMFAVILSATGVVVASASDIGFITLPVLLLAAFSVWKWISWSKLNLSDERYQLAQKLLDIFARDQVENDPVSVRLDFFGIKAKQNILRKLRDRIVYKSNWLTMSGKYADGTRFTLRVSETVHVKFRKGKYKPKGYLVSLTVAFSKKNYGNLKLRQDLAYKAIRVKSNSLIKSCKVKGGVLQLSAVLPPTFITKTISDDLTQLITLLLLSSYEVLRSQAHTADSPAS